MKCFFCGGTLKPNDYRTRILQGRFGNGEKTEVCDKCGDEANNAVQLARSKYGFNSNNWKIMMTKFKCKNNIPLFGTLNAMQSELVEQRVKVQMRLMFIMDIRFVRNHFRTTTQSK